MNNHPCAGELMAGRLWKVSIQHLGESCHSAPAPPDAAPHLAQCRTACRVITTILPPSRHQQVGCGWVVSHSALVTSLTNRWDVGGWCPTVHWSPHKQVGGVPQCTGHLTNRWVVSYCGLVTSFDCCTLLIKLTKFGLTTSDFQCHHYC